MLITFEGLPGAGKSTQSRMLARCLEASGHPVTVVPDLATLDTDPVAATLVDLLRTSGDPFLRSGDAITDTMITVAIRADLVATVLDPALAENPAAVVIEDRGIHTMASYAIAALLRQHRAPTDVALDWLNALTALAGPRPTRALWLRVPPNVAARRADERGGGRRPAFTSEQRAHLTWIDHAYALLAERDPQLAVLDVTDLDPVGTHLAIHATLRQISQTGDIDLSQCEGHHETAEPVSYAGHARPRPSVSSRNRESETMTTLASHREHTAPTDLLNALRTARAVGADALAATLHEHGLHALDGGRNNDVFAWTAATTPICIKLFKKTDRQRVEREWHGLIHASSLGNAPKPLWLDEDTEQPALGMTLLPGSPILDVLDPASAITSLAKATRALQNVPLSEPLASLERVDSIGHYIARLTDVWPGQLADSTDDPQTPDMLALLRRWENSGDAELLARPATRVYSRGDANLLNWLHDGETTYVADFEFSGFSDVAVDAADHIEHISARVIPDDVWGSAEADLGVTPGNRARFDAARRTIALRWLAVLWKQRTKRVEEFTALHERVRALQG
ncbi:Thymidylate kinase [Alloactinosynnema sp. L-07]|uniref:phosphotransferase n=1 Tax=Alloactinosynnema sp. L-07 TaxID=1653480 RepID=UPI00065F0422|nr:phosphotransferase [Alloactinosynnema sp. L-07]CRK55231.1 Thymidylate kinase [Alloactinosynnema sp. L-07]